MLICLCLNNVLRVQPIFKKFHTHKALINEILIDYNKFLLSAINTYYSLFLKFKGFMMWERNIQGISLYKINLQFIKMIRSYIRFSIFPFNIYFCNFIVLLNLLKLLNIEAHRVKVLLLPIVYFLTK